MKIPERLYHATIKDRADSIWMHGLRQGRDGFVYLADTINGAASFLVVRGARLEDIVVFEIDPESLDVKLLSYGTDHNPDFFKGIEVFAYMGEIDPICFDEVYTLYRLEDEKQ